MRWSPVAAYYPALRMNPNKGARHAEWTTRPERSNQFMMRVMTWVSLHLGRSIARSFLPLIAGYFLCFAPASRRTSRAYLTRVLARPVTWRDVYRHFWTFAATVHDRIYLVNRRFDLFEFDIHGEDKLRAVLSEGKGLFLLGAHLGSFEVIRALGRKTPGLRVAMLMHEPNARKINSMLAAINPEATQDIIGLGHVDSMLQVHARLARGETVGMLADRTLGDDILHPVPLLGDTAYLPEGPFRMAALLQRPVLFMVGLYQGGNRYAIHFEPLADFSTVDRSQRDQAVLAALVRYGALLDHYCRKAPYNWFNFYDFWRHPS